jgi:methanogenic corrinoid protein MtbC1
MTFHISTVKSLIEQVRASDMVHPVKIMVGGYPFNVEPNLWRQLKADGHAQDAQAAIDTAVQLVNTGG